MTSTRRPHLTCEASEWRDSFQDIWFTVSLYTCGSSVHIVRESAAFMAQGIGAVLLAPGLVLRCA
eukprot:6373112-Amphidinium_carterae.1